MNITGNTILITGGSSGIGKALVEYFYKQKNQIIVVGRDNHKLERLKITFPEMIIKQCDLSNQDDINRLVQDCYLHHPEINILINNAGVEKNYIFSSNEKISDEKISEELDTNLKAPILLSNGLLNLISKNNNTAIVNISSALAYAPKVNAAVYSATKSGLHHFTKAFRQQLKNSPILIFEVLPPLTDTPLTITNSNSKISVNQLIKEFVKAFKKNKTTIRIGRTKWIYLLHRVAPQLLKCIMMKRFEKQNKVDL